MAAMTPMTVHVTAVKTAIHSDVLKARSTASFSRSLPYQCKLKPVIGKPPNIEALNERTIVTMIGANMKM